LRRAAEQRAGQGVIGIAEVGVVQDVEELAPETKPDFLGDAKYPLQPNIHLRSAEAPQHIAPEVTLLPDGWCRKGRLVENFAARISVPGELERHSWI
jgi:hypothetical protein